MTSGTRECPWGRLGRTAGVRGMGSSGRGGSSRLPAKARPEEDAGAVRRRHIPQDAGLRDPAPRRPAAPLRPAARAERRSRELGRPERAPVPVGRASPRRCTSRTTRSTTRRSRASSRPGSTARARSRSGTAGRTSSSRRNAAAASPSVSTASAPRGSGRSSRRDSTATSGTGCSSGRTRRPTTHLRFVPSSPSSPSGSRRARAGSTSRSGTGTGRSSPSPAREATLTSRNGTDLTERFRDIARAAARAVRTPSAVIDGEVCALDEDGTTRFEALQSGAGRLILMAFDLLSVDDEPVHTRPLEERRRLLEELLDPSVEEVRLSPAFDDGDALLAAAKAQGLEGVVAKRADAPYRPGRRTPEWQKVKLRAQEDFPIVGYTRGTGRRAKLGALVLGRRDTDGLHWAGNVGSGLTDGEVDRLRELLRPLERASSCTRVDAEDAARPVVGRHLGRAGAVGRGDLRGDDPGGTAAGAGVPRGPRRCAHGAPPDRAGDPARTPHAEALQPRQAVLARGGDHEGRAARATTATSRPCSSRTCASGRSR